MGEHRLATPSQRPPQEEVLRRVGQVVLPPDDVGHGHVHVVDHVGQDEHGGAVGLEDHEVLDLGVLEHGLAPHEICHHRRALFGDAEAQGPTRTRAQTAVATVPVVAWRRPAPGPGFDLLPGAVAPVGVTPRDQPLRPRPVQLPPLGLQVGTLVPVEAEPRHGRGDGGEPLGAAPLLVRVLYPEDEGALGLAGVEPVEQRGASRTHVEQARGGRREAKTRLARHCGPR